MLKLYDFTKAELQMFTDNCNFTDEELICFQLRSKNCSIVEISMKMNVSTAKVSILIKKIKAKMLRIL